MQGLRAFEVHHSAPIRRVCYHRDDRAQGRSRARVAGRRQDGAPASISAGGSLIPLHRPISSAAAVTALLSVSGLVHAAANPTHRLLQTAVHNTNTVRTLVYHDTTVQTVRQATIRLQTDGQEDEVRNRERDREVLTVRTHLKTGKVRTLHYTIDIIFMNGKTYYRSSLAKNRWQTHAGMTLCDHFSGICWHRGRTTVPTFKGVAFTGHTAAGGAVHLHSSLHRGTTRGTVDVVISPGPTRYVTGISERVRVAIKGRQIMQERVDQHYGPFNTPLSIQPPAPSQGTPS